jgi:hypothetical protein
MDQRVMNRDHPDRGGMFIAGTEKSKTLRSSDGRTGHFVKASQLVSAPSELRRVLCLFYAINIPLLSE